MTWLARAGWLLSAVFFATILSSMLHVDHIGGVAEGLLVLFVVIAAIRPDIGTILVVLIAPVAWYLAGGIWNQTVVWAEAVVCAVVTGVSLNGSFRRPSTGSRSLGTGKAEAASRVEAEATRLDRTPAILFGAFVIASLIASFGIKALRAGPGFTDALWVQLTREYFVDLRGFPGLHAGTLLLEGLLLFAVGARVAADRAGDARFLRRAAAAAVAGATLAAWFNIDRLLHSAWRGESFWTSLAGLAANVRLNVHYADYNAAGSYFVMAALLAAALAVSTRGARRIVWMAAAATIVTALWLTSSRTAMLAGFVAPGAVLFVAARSRGRARAVRALGIAAAGIILVAMVALALPQRGTQKSLWPSADVRVGLIQTGLRMMAARPVFGIGLGEFVQRSGEFSSPDLIAKFPVAVHENAHNNFIQVAAELGVAGGIFFAWLVIAALITIARRAADTREPFLLLTLAAVGAFVLTCLGGHPLLVPEAGYVFWTMLGAAAGSSALAPPSPSRVRWLVPIVLIALAFTMPWRLRETTQDADLEHVGIGVSAWQTSPDDIRYREAVGHASLFVPEGAIRWSVYPLADRPLQLELKLDGRVANVVTVAPRRWNELNLPARTRPSGARSVRLDQRLISSDETAIWITKVQPIR